MSTDDLPKPDYANNMRLIGYSDQGGRPDGVQIIVVKDHAFIGHMFSQGFSVLDVSNPRQPRPVAYIKGPPNTWTLHLQAHDDLLLVVNSKDFYRDAVLMDERQYYIGSVGDKLGAQAQRGYSAGFRVYDIKIRFAARNRFHAGRRRRRAQNLVCRWAMGLYVRAARRLLGFHLPDSRHGGSDETEDIRQILATGNAYGGGRNPVVGPHEAALFLSSWAGLGRHGLCHLAGWRRHAARPLGQDGAEAHHPPQLVSSLRRGNAQRAAARRTRSARGSRLSHIAGLRRRHQAGLGFDIRVPSNPISISTFPICPKQSGKRSLAYETYYVARDGARNKVQHFAAERKVDSKWQA